MADLETILNAEPEPAFIVGEDGTIEFSTLAASNLNPGLKPGENILAAAKEPDKLKRFLHRCAGYRSRCVGTLILTDGHGKPAPFRVNANRLNRPEDGPARLFLRCLPASDPRFAFLTKQLDQLNREVRKRRHLQAVLEESVKQRELLIREMHHRVKNNVATLAAMISLAQAETASSEARSILQATEGRVAAIGAIQDVLYHSDRLAEAPAQQFIDILVRHLKPMLPRGATLVVQVGDFVVPAEHTLPLALIVNELAANAVKHGLRERSEAEVKIQFFFDGSRYCLMVRNPGKPFDVENARRHASGLGLVRGLVRQLHGSFDVTFDRDVCCVVEYEGMRRSADGHGSGGNAPRH